MKKVVVAAVLLIALASVVIYAYVSKSQSSEGQGPGQGAASLPVSLARVAVSHIAQRIAVTGTINARAEVEVYPKQAGELIELSVDKGARVHAGQILGRIDTKQLSLQVEQAEAELVGAQASYAKNSSLAFVNADTDLKQAKSNLEQLQAALTQAELDLQLQTKKAQVDIKKAQADLQIAEARLDAAVSGARTQEVEQVRVRRDNAKRELDRLTALLKDEIIPQSQVDAAQLQYEIYSAQLSLLEEGTRPEDIAILKGQVDVAQTSLESAEDNLQLIDIKKASLEAAKAQVENARAAYEQASAATEAETWKKELAQVEATVKRAQATYELTQQRLDEGVIRAPINGVIAQRMLDRGDMALPSQPFVTIVDMDVVKVEAKVPGRDLASLRVGAVATIKPDAYPGETFTGKIVFISPTIDRTSQTVDIEIEVPNSEHRLKPGMYCRVELIVQERLDVPAVPIEALVREGLETFVFVVNDGKALKHPVTTGISDSVQVEIVSGLKAGDSFVLGGKYSLKDGMAVKVASSGE